MSYAPPNKAAFIAIFPSFAAVSDEAYAFWSGQAATLVDPFTDCLGTRADLAAMRATAWYLTDAGIGTGAESEMAANGASGFKSIKSSSLSLERGESSVKDIGVYGSNSYGGQFYAMIKPCLAGPRVTGTGSLMGGCGYRSGPLPWQ